MIVRCTNCNSAFAVDDEKVANKKFAFSCPKCGADNIYDNRKSAKKENLIEDTFLDEEDHLSSTKEDALFDDDFVAPEKTDQFSDDEIFGKEKRSPEEDFISDSFSEEGLDSTTHEELIDEFAEEPITKGKRSQKEDLFNDDLTIDESDFPDEEGLVIEDTDLQEKGDRDTKISSQEDIDAMFADIDEFEKSNPQKELEIEDDTTVDIDSLDIDLEEDLHDEELVVKSEKLKGKGKPLEDDDDITLDLDTLDLDIEEEPAPQKQKSLKSKIQEEGLFDEELTLSVDEMDVNIDDLTEEPQAQTLEPSPAKSARKSVKIEESTEDESITIDLDSLDIDVEESSDLLSGELTEEEEKLTLEDAGLTFSELDERKKPSEDEIFDEDLVLSIDEIDPDLKLEVIGDKIEKTPVVEELEELPEIDLEEYEATIQEETPSKKIAQVESPMESLDDFMLSDEEIYTPKSTSLDIFDYDERESERYLPEKGSCTFSVDFSLKYSRIGALLRLLLIYVISMIPHLIVMFLYTLVSAVLGFINQIVILTTGHCVEDFSLITENTLRYFLYIKTNIIGIVEDRPVYAGREKLNHQLQLDITYPVKYSKIMALLRLSIIGIIAILIPHIIVMLLLTITVLFVYLAGIVMVIATRRWPNPLFVYLTRYFRYLARISSFAIGLTDEYPPFKFD